MTDALTVLNRLGPRPPRKVVHQRELAALRQFEQILGGRLALIDALQHAPATETNDYILGLIADPANDDTPLTVLCEEAGIRLSTLLALFKESELTRAQVLAIRRLAQSLPEITDDFLRRALTHTVPCPTCDGVVPMDFGDGESPAPCETCGGRGSLTRQPELARQKLVLEMGGLLKPSGGVQVNVTNEQHHQTVLVDSALTQFMRASDQVLDARRAVRLPALAASLSPPAEGD